MYSFFTLLYICFTENLPCLLFNFFNFIWLITYLDDHINFPSSFKGQWAYGKAFLINAHYNRVRLSSCLCCICVYVCLYCLCVQTEFSLLFSNALKVRFYDCCSLYSLIHWDYSSASGHLWITKGVDCENWR